AMRPAQLHGERRCWNRHLVTQVVWRKIFLKIRVLRNMRYLFQKPVPYQIAASAAVREDGIANQDDRGAVLVVVADLINSRILHQLSGSQQTAFLIDQCVIFLFPFHCFVSIPFPGPGRWRAVSKMWPSVSRLA